MLRGGTTGVMGRDRPVSTLEYGGLAGSGSVLSTEGAALALVLGRGAGCRPLSVIVDRRSEAGREILLLAGVRRAEVGDPGGLLALKKDMLRDVRHAAAHMPAGSEDKAVSSIAEMRPVFSVECGVSGQSEERE